MRVLGIDPGLTGAIAAYDGERLAVHDMPVTVQGKRSVLDSARLLDILQRDLLSAWRGASSPVYLEHVRASARQAGQSEFVRGAGIIEGMVIALEHRVVLVPPPTWKLQMGLRGPRGERKTDRKRRSRERAAELFPGHARLFARAKDDGRAEAALIARWGWLQETNA